ncbi:MAG: DNA polymerase/3'-5' exonuclease PolX [Solirubrobacterales bacterium]|nr:DNA polymerase/3'-5' exonuclease PolX [Solirubrobacterales bacterium]
MAEPTNSEIAAALDELGDLHELDGAIVHRIVAYRNAAKAVREAPVSVTGMARQGRATELAGIGATIQEKVLALADEGAIPAAVRLRAKFPAGLLEITRLPGLGPKRARRLYEELSIDSLAALQTAAAAQRIRALKGFGPRAEESLLAAANAAIAARCVAADGQDGRDGGPGRMVLGRALAIGEQLVAALLAHPASERVQLAGSARRMTDSVKDLDVIATAHEPLALARAAAELDLVESAQTPGEAGVRLRTHTGLRVDMRIVAPDQFGNLMQHFTGSKEHNVALREASVRKGLHVSEYGVKDDATGETYRCAREEEVYALLGLDYIEPELRENRGELTAAAAHALPSLVSTSDLRGDLHCHTTTSDGTASIQEMAIAAREAGYEYLAITDHSASFGFGDEVSSDELRAQIDRIHALSGTDAVAGMRLLAGSEVNILPDGSLDYADEILAELDWVVASVHSSFQMPAEAMTARITAAIANPLVDVIGHLSGRKIERRPPYALHFPAIVEAAVAHGTMLEINASPDRRDLNELHARAAAAAGVGIVINCDAHRTGGFEVARYGVATARRAWLGPDAILNTRPWVQLRARRPRHR